MTASLTTLTVPLDPASLTAVAGNAAAGATASTMQGPIDFLRTEDALCWIRRGEGLVAFGEVAHFSGTGPERFNDAEEWWKQLLESALVEDQIRLPGTGPIAFGSFAFSKTSAHESRLVVPRIVAGFAAGQAWLTQLAFDGGRLTAAGAHAALDRLLAGTAAASSPTDPSPSTGSSAGLGAAADAAAAVAVSPVGTAVRTATAEAAVAPDARLTTGSLSEEEWMETVAAGVRAIESGRLEKVVLARDIVARFEEPVSRAGILRNLAQRYSECWTYGVGPLVGSTPEMLIKIDGTTAQARVLAGTLDRHGAPEDGAGFAQRVLGGSQKQRQEHDFAVHSLTRQLAPFATDLSFPAEPFILELPNVWHLASDVKAELADVEGHLPTSLALVEALHPTAAVCGTPRTEAGILIRELEQLDRGPYAGPVGWLDGAGNGEWGIALRGAVVEDPRTVRLYAGCGIVEASDPAAELAETWAKFRPMLQALGLHS
ncbi:MAG TPA: isochorismate synthase [Micrococcaceae bacterium]|nr:isochorismate synthase [Micrococcaceae bacterium]